MTPEAVVSRLQVLAATVTGINTAPDALPDHLALFPAAVSYLESLRTAVINSAAIPSSTA